MLPHDNVATAAAASTFANGHVATDADYDLSHDMRFPTMWHFDKCRLRQACAAPFYA